MLPFTSVGGQAEQQVLAEAITDDLTHDLSCIPGTLVIAQGTAITLKGKSVDARAAAREFAVRYVVDGSVRIGPPGANGRWTMIPTTRLMAGAATFQAISRCDAAIPPPPKRARKSGTGEAPNIVKLASGRQRTVLWRRCLVREAWPKEHPRAILAVR